MRIFKYDKQYRFYSMFDTITGTYMRSGVLDESTIDRKNDPFCSFAKDTGEDPFMASFPELLDIGIMGHCIHGATGLCMKSGVECYQSGLTANNPNMSVEDYKSIIDQCRGKVFQIALGGCGDPDQHENFEEILDITRARNIVPNFTTSGLGMTKEIAALCKKYCGAVAVSWYRSPCTLRAIEMLINAKVRTNIHYVLNTSTIDEAIEHLEKRDFPEGINAVVFLLHKPVGLGSEQKTIRVGDEKMEKLVALVTEHHDYPFKIGFDSCTVPALINHPGTVDLNSLDTCEGARWSAYISADMQMLPCSFDCEQKRWAVDLKKHTVQEAWESEAFESFRSHFRNACPNCPKRHSCLGGCPIVPSVVLCGNKKRTSRNG